MTFPIARSGNSDPMKITPSSDAISSFGRATQDVGVGAIIGGNLFARVGMHPAMRKVSDPGQRGSVVNDAWRRYGTVNTLSLVAIVAGWAGARADEASPVMLSEDERKLALAKDVCVGLVVTTGLAAAAAGVAFGQMEPDGAVPLTDGDTAAPEATESEAKTKRALSMIGASHLASAVALAGTNAALSQLSFRRPPARRLLRRRY